MYRSGKTKTIPAKKVTTMSEKQIFNKAYVEITNKCNLNCSFCKGTEREKAFMSVEKFRIAAQKLRCVTGYIYLHILGEPTLHPHLGEILDICKELDFKVIITTNGTLLCKIGELLLSKESLHKVNISLHAFEANSGIDFEKYLDSCFEFGKQLTDKGKICVLRLWNGDSKNIKGENSRNSDIVSKLKEKFSEEWQENTKGYRIRNKLFLEFAERFNWREDTISNEINCYGLRDQVGVLVDGRVVPCCIDCDGAITLGNIFEDGIEEIVSSPRALALAEGFKNGRAVEEYCKKCGFVRTRL